MTLDQQISFASKALYLMGIIAIVHALTSGFLVVTWVLGSGVVDIGSVWVLQGHAIGYGFEALGIILLFWSGYAVGHRDVRSMFNVLRFLAVDCLAFFVRAQNMGPGSAGMGLFASFLVVFHAIVFWWVLRACLAMRQTGINAAVLRQVRFDAELRRRLAESDEPPPPAATFDTRFRWAPPSGPEPPPQPQS